MPCHAHLPISIHTALAGCDICENGKDRNGKVFQSTQPSQAVTPLEQRYFLRVMKFQSTQPSQAVTVRKGKTIVDKDGFQSTQPSQAVTSLNTVPGVVHIISIHTALAGCDYAGYRSFDGYRISIHTALAGCDSNNTQQKPHSNRHNHIQCIYI